MGFLNTLADVGDKFDRLVYGHKMMIFIVISFITVFWPLLIHWLSGDPGTMWRSFLTITLLLYLITCFFSWLAIWRDEDNNWSIKVAWPVIKESCIGGWQNMKSAFKHEGMLKWFYAGLQLLILGVTLYALGNVSHLIGSLLKDELGIPAGLRGLTLTLWYGGAFLTVAGPVLISVAIFKDRTIFSRIWTRRKALSKVNWTLSPSTEMVIDATSYSQNPQANRIAKGTMDKVLKSIHEWKPRRYLTLEKPLQVNLKNKLERDHPDFDVNIEYPLEGRRRADIVVNGSLMIEMKKDFKTYQRYRADGQLNQYIKDWGNQGPIIFLVGREDFTTVKEPLKQMISEKRAIKKDIIAVVGAKPAPD